MGVVLVEVDATVGELAEGSLLLNFGRGLSVLFNEMVSIDSSRGHREGMESANLRKERFN